MKRLRTTLLISILSLAAIASLSACQPSSEPSGEEQAILTDAPNVPPPITRSYPTKVIVNLETREVTGQLADGVQYQFWTFGGHVPGKFIRVREGDTVEVHLHNSSDSKMAHNIDLHAVAGPGGGATSSETAPGHTSVFAFKALHPGLFIYHCATAPVGMHIANGMYGMILVQPKEGLPKVDHEYYIMQSEFYTEGDYGAPGLQPFDMQKALDEKPTYVVFNGSVGAITGDHALKAKVGETIRLYVGNVGPNLDSSFHVIGAVFDNVHQEGGTQINHQVQTTLIPAGGTTIAELKVEVPGSYALVDHSIFRAFNKGALGMIKVDGPENKKIYSGKIRDEADRPNELSDAQTPAQAPAPAPASAPAPVAASTTATAKQAHSPLLVKTKSARIDSGREVFQTICITCHQANGQGMPGVFPPLAKSDFLNADKKRAIGVVMHGRSGSIVVNGKTIVGAMPELNLSDDQIANVLSFVYSNWGNSGQEVTPAEVAKIRAKGAGK